MGAVDGADVEVGMTGGAVMVDSPDVTGGPTSVAVLSMQPQNRPGVRQDVLVKVGVGVVVVMVVVVLSLQPNQPGVRQVVVVTVVVTTGIDVVWEPVPVVVSSKQPHHPGVWQVSVRVRVLLVEVEVVDDVVVSVPLLSYIFQFPQSRHSGVNLHSGTVSYFRMTS